jgi:hypothetical protein
LRLGLEPGDRVGIWSITGKIQKFVMRERLAAELGVTAEKTA